MPRKILGTITIRRTASFVSALVLATAILTAGNPAWSAASDEEIAVSLATLLRAARAVISKNQKHINDPEVGDKGLSAEMVVATAKENYKKATNQDLDSTTARCTARLSRSPWTLATV